MDSCPESNYQQLLHSLLKVRKQIFLPLLLEEGKGHLYMLRLDTEQTDKEQLRCIYM